MNTPSKFAMTIIAGMLASLSGCASVDQQATISAPLVITAQ